MEMSFDERAAAEHMSYCFGTEHYEMVLKAGDMERCLPKYLWHLEDPRVGQSYPNYYAAKLSSRFVKVVLAGTGGDELFGGYPWRYFGANGYSNFGEYTDSYYRYWQRLIRTSLLQTSSARFAHNLQIQTHARYFEMYSVGYRRSAPTQMTTSMPLCTSRPRHFFMASFLSRTNLQWPLVRRRVFRSWTTISLISPSVCPRA